MGGEDLQPTMEEYKKKVKDTIKALISNGQIDQASELINQYENIVKDDIDILTMKSIVFMLSDRLSEAEDLLWKGLEIANTNSDILYNLGYLYQSQGKINRALNFYNRALQHTNDEELRSNIIDNINTLEGMYQKDKYNRPKRFVILSSCAWGVMLQRPHQMAKALSREGYPVDFIEPITRGELNNQNSTINDIVNFCMSNVKEFELIRIFKPLALYYENSFVMNNLTELVQNIIDNSLEEIIIISYFPSYINIINQFRGNFKVVYDCVDDHGDLEYSYWSSKQDREFEQLLLDRADIILTTSHALYLSKVIYKDNVYLSKNAVNIKDFSNNTVPNEMPEDLHNIPEPRICYMGAVDKWFNEELFYKVVRENRDKSFVIIGPVKDGILSYKEENLHVLGVRPHNQLRNYLTNMAVGIIPFKDDIDIIVNCDPIKLYEYLSCGLPVVSTNLPELALGKDYIKVCHDFDAFNKALNKAVSMKPDINEVSDFITQNTWENRILQLLDIIKGNGEEYSKARVFPKLKEDWGNLLKTNKNPILESIYSLTFTGNDNQKFLQFAEEAYNALPIKYNLKNYIYALVQCEEIDKSVDVIINDSNIENQYKAELAYAAKNKDKQTVVLKLMYCINNFYEIRRMLQAIKGNEKVIESAHYYYEIGDYQKSLENYIKLLNNNKLIDKSPLAVYNCSDLYKMGNHAAKGRKFFNRYKELLKRYLNIDIELVDAKDLSVDSQNEENQTNNSIEQNTKTTKDNNSSKSKGQGKTPRFSIVIPTRNNPETLKYTLKTCINQEFDDYEIVVSDNSSDNRTKELINYINCSKIKYISPDKELAMTENFNFAVENSTGDYVIVLGSDDGLLFHALSKIDIALRELNVDLLRWELAAYGWPDVKIPTSVNILTIPCAVQKFNINYMMVENIIEKVLNFELRYSSLPMLYINSVVSRKLINELKEKTGKIYDSVSPDVYSGFAFAYLTGDRYASLTVPMSIGGMSGRSNGISCTVVGGKENKIKEDFVKLNSQFGYRYPDSVPWIKSEECAVIDSFLRAKENLFPHNEELSVNREKFLEKCILSIHENHEDFQSDMDAIYKSLDDKKELQQWFYKNFSNNPDFKGFPEKNYSRYVGFLQNGGLNIDTLEFGVKDIYGAAELFRKITGL